MTEKSSILKAQKMKTYEAWLAKNGHCRQVRIVQKVALSKVLAFQKVGKFHTTFYMIRGRFVESV